MTKIEELKKAFEASTPGEWCFSRLGTPDWAPQFGVYSVGEGNDLAIVKGEANPEFITLAHNLMPQLLEAVGLLAENLAAWEGEEDSVQSEHYGLIKDTTEFLESLK